MPDPLEISYVCGAIEIHLFTYDGHGFGRRALSEDRFRHIPREDFGPRENHKRHHEKGDGSK
jgi:hypothetical protein